MTEEIYFIMPIGGRWGVRNIESSDRAMHKILVHVSEKKSRCASRSRKDNICALGSQVRHGRAAAPRERRAPVPSCMQAARASSRRPAPLATGVRYVVILHVARPRRFVFYVPESTPQLWSARAGLAPWRHSSRARSAGTADGRRAHHQQRRRLGSSTALNNDQLLRSSGHHHLSNA